MLCLGVQEAQHAARNNRIQSDGRSLASKRFKVRYDPLFSHLNIEQVLNRHAWMIGTHLSQYSLKLSVRNPAKHLR